MNSINPPFTRADLNLMISSLVKIVRFASHDRVRKIPHINDLSGEEVDAVWMHPDEFRAIRKECQSIILFIEHGSDVPDGMELCRLEHHMSKWKEQAQAMQLLLYDTADEIQDYGDDSSIDVSDVLASMCHKISSRQEELARKIALEDEKQARS
jgi:hypothetical protein